MPPQLAPIIQLLSALMASKPARHALAQGVKTSRSSGNLLPGIGGRAATAKWWKTGRKNLRKRADTQLVPLEPDAADLALTQQMAGQSGQSPSDLLNTANALRHRRGLLDRFTLREELPAPGVAGFRMSPRDQRKFLKEIEQQDIRFGDLLDYLDNAEFVGQGPAMADEVMRNIAGGPEMEDMILLLQHLMRGDK